MAEHNKHVFFRVLEFYPLLCYLYFFLTKLQSGYLLFTCSKGKTELIKYYFLALFLEFHSNIFDGICIERNIFPSDLFGYFAIFLGAELFLNSYFFTSVKNGLEDAFSKELCLKDLEFLVNSLHDELISLPLFDHSLQEIKILLTNHI